MNESLTEHIRNSPLVQAAITEAVHRFYYDRILSNQKKDKQDLQETQASDILSTLWNLQPNWRYILQKTAKRYKATDKQSLPICSRPKKRVPLKIEIELR